jgi:FKBP-type peptidyl-prolyl cis-trans isomerase 2
VQRGDFVKINYIGRLDSGEIFDLIDEEIAKKEKIYNPKIRYSPIPIIIGAGFLVPGLEKAILDMEVGDKRKIDVKPEDGFGQRDPKLIRTVPRKVFRNQKLDPLPGMVVDFSGTKGRIQSVDAGRVRVDFNNPLAGKTLHYEIEIKEKIEDPKEKIKSIFEFFGIKDADIKIENKEATIKTISLPSQLKDKISSLIIEYIKMEKVHFTETFEKKNNKGL